MLPKRLSIKGFYSYKETQVIDFERLTQAGLFGIFGKVGAGKSSIIEAITFALYGKIDRISNSGYSYNITNLSSDNFEICFDFSVSGQHYRFVREGRRNKKKFDDVSVNARFFSTDAKGENPAPTDKSVEEIIGLGYDDFRRAVIIPQGNFQEFLELSNTKRNEMLQNLFGLERFDLAHKAKQLKEVNQSKISHIEGILATFRGISDEILNDLLTQKKDLAAAITQQELDSTQQKIVLDKLQNLKEQIKRKEEKQQILAELLKKETQYQERQANLNLFQKAVQEAKPILIGWENAKQDLKNADEQLIKSEKDLNSSQILRGKANDVLEKAKIIDQNRTQQKVILADLEFLVRIKDKEKKIADCAERIKNGKTHIESTENNINIIKQKREKLHERVMLLQKNSIDIQEVMEILAWHNTLSQIQDKQSEIHKYTVQLATEKENLLLIRQQFTSIKTASENDWDTINIKFEQQKTDLKTAFETLNNQKLLLVQQQALSSHVHTLHDGAPCPLCGAKEHPQPLNSAVNSAEIGDNENAIKANKIQVETLEKEAEKWLVAAEKLKANSENYKKNQRDIATVQEELTKHQLAYTWSNFAAKDKAKIEEAKTQYGQQTKEKQAIEQQLTKISKDLDTETENLKKYTEGISNIEKEKVAAQAESEMFEAQIKILSITEKEKADLQTIESQIKNIEIELKATENILQQATEKQRQNEVEFITNTTRYSEHQKQQKEKQEAFQKEQKKLDNYLINSAFANLETLITILAKAINTTQEQNEINQFGEQLAIAKSDLQTAIAQVADQQYDVSAHRALNEKQNTLIKQIDDNKIRLGTLNNQVVEMTNDLKNQKDALKNKEQLDIRAKNIETLEKLFKAKGFVDFISRMYLLNLVNIANSRFRKMTQEQLELSIDDKNNFDIIDRLNGGRKRSVGTLSGGQKFQASLCLALALADSISSTSGENFFFLDEGFGSLDKITLQLVFDTLQSLRKENRVVGIISHVEDMQQEVENYIYVTRDEQRGSMLNVMHSSGN